MKKLVVAGDLYIFIHDLEKYINHCKELKKELSIKDFNYFVKTQQNKKVK